MREHPWHERRLNFIHYQWFQNLVDLHALTTTWVKDLDFDQPTTPHQLKRVLSPRTHENLWMLEAITRTTLPTELETLLDDSTPEELLSRLEYTIWAMQAWTYSNIFQKTPANERDALRNALEQSSWKAGRQCGQDRWAKLPKRYRNDIRDLLRTLQDSPLSGYPHRKAFLILRGTPQVVQLELLSCPHTSPYHEVQAIASPLCELHSHWMRGFLYGIHHQTLLEHIVSSKKGGKRCQQVWCFHDGG